jgi:hypothetical protein
VAILKKKPLRSERDIFKMTPALYQQKATKKFVRKNYKSLTYTVGGDFRPSETDPVSLRFASKRKIFLYEIGAPYLRLRVIDWRKKN